MKSITIRHSYYTGKPYRLVLDDSGLWRFVPAEPNCPIYIRKQGDEVLYLDSEGFGVPLCVGEHLRGGLIVKAIVGRDDGWFVELEKKAARQ